MTPIALFVYNRPWHTRQTVEALQRCKLAAESDLYIFADGPKADAKGEQKTKISEVRNYIHNIDGFHSVTIEESESNMGLANSVISGVTKVIKKNGRAIVVEDDIVAHPFFLRFMNEALDTYQKNQKIFAISATMERFLMPPNYGKDIFLTYRFGSWGWATWADRWNTVDWNINNYPIIKRSTKKQIKHFCKGGADLWPMLQAQAYNIIDSWAIRMGYNMSLQNKLCLRPTYSLVSNIGMDGSGIHCGNYGTNLLPIYNEETYNIDLIQLPKLNKKITHSIQAIFSDGSRKTVRLWKNVILRFKQLIRFLNK